MNRKNLLPQRNLRTSYIGQQLACVLVPALQFFYHITITMSHRGLLLRKLCNINIAVKT